MVKTFFFAIACMQFITLNGSQLIVGTNAEFPPYCTIEKGEIVGFDIDVAKEVAQRLGKTIQFKDMPFEGLIPAIILNQLDFIAAGMSYTEERGKRVSFTKNYLSDDPLVILTKDQKMNLEDLENKMVVVIEGFTADQYVSTKTSIIPMRLSTQADGFMALISGRAEAFITARTTVDDFLEKKKEIKFYTTLIEGTGETCALVIPKDKSEMLKQVQWALDQMEMDGTLEKLKAKLKIR